MSFSLSCARATITKLTVDKRPADDGHKEVVTALKVTVKTSADILAEFHPSLRAALFVNGGGIRFGPMKEIGWEGTRRNTEIFVRPGPDMKPAFRLAAVTLRDFKLKPLEEGSEQLVALRFVVDVNDPVSPVGRLLEYLKEEAWIDVHGGGELDLAPPSARTEISELNEADKAAVAASAGLPECASDKAPESVKASDVDAVRRMQPTRKGVRAKLISYPDEVLTAAIAAENAAANCRPMFIHVIEAELERRAKEANP